MKKTISVFSLRNWWKVKKEKMKKHQFEEKLLSCGERLILFGTPTVTSPHRLSIGDDCRINDDVYINARSGVSIGNNVTLSQGCKIISTGYNVDSFLIKGERIHDEESPVSIGSHVWICAGAIILPGVKITGEYVIVAAGAVVRHDIIDSHVVVAGNPGRIVKRIEVKDAES